MKNKFARIGKKAISLALAFAVVAVSMFTVIAVSVSAETSAATELTWDGTVATSFSDTTHQGTSWDDAIIISTPEELAYLVKGAGGTTKGKYYKIADGITAFNMDGLKDITLNSTVVDVEAADATSKNWGVTFNNGDTHFNGNFDGNGITVYNIYCASHAAGLFPTADSGSTFKNVAVKNSRLLDNISTTNMAAGGIFGFHLHSEGTITISNCAVENCQIESDGTLGAGSIAGCARYRNVTVENCLAIDNSLKADDGTTGIVGQADGGGITVKNTINIGSATAPTNSGTYSDVYTTETSPLVTSGVTTIKASDITGKDAITKLSGFDFVSTWWAVSSDLPQLRALHKITATDNGDGTHKFVCQICKLTGFSEEHNYVIDPTTEKAKCSCGLEKTGLTLTWNGTLASGFTDKSTGTAEDPIIITTAEEFAYLVKGAGGTTKGKYYKVADCIKAFNMNGMTGITVNSTATDVKSATPTSKNWSATVSNNTPFCGIFDGNGVTVYNIYCTNSWAAGLFPCINPTTIDTVKTTFKNVTVTASYFEANSGQHTFGAGAIFGAHINDSNNQDILVENCAVTNNVIHGALKDGDTACIRYGAIGGAVPWRNTYIDNCLVKGNSFVDNTGTASSSGLIGQRGGSVYVTNTLVIDSPVNSSNVNQWDYFGKVYATDTATVSGVTVVTTENITGATAKTTLTGFDFDKVWFANKGTPVLRVSHNIKATPDGATGHKEECTDCDLEGLATTPHTYGDDHVCTTCKYECKHTDAKWVKSTDGDCVTAPTGKYVCDCGFESTEGPDMTFKAGHKFGEVVTAKDATCTSDGTVAYKHCSVCDKDFAADASDTEPMSNALETVVSESAKGHVFGENVSANPATCTEDGNVAYKHCSVCDKDFDVDADEKSTEYLETTVVTATGHTFGEDIKATDATCTEDATVAHKHCSVCDKDFELKADEKSTTPLTTIVEEGTATGHRNVEFVAEVPATTENEGTKAHYKCSDCEKLFKDEACTTETTLDELKIDKVPVESGWVLDGTGWWYRNNSAKGYATGWEIIDGAWYYFNEGGYMVTGWLNLGGTWYYMSGSGAMVTDWQIIGGSWYYFNAGGDMVSNAWVGGYYLSASGAMTTPSWQLDGNGWWYSYGDGTYAANQWLLIDGTWYYFNAAGYVSTGWQVIGGSWYYFLSGGQMVTDWQLIGGSWYYFYADGSMAANCYVGGYWLTASGAMA